MPNEEQYSMDPRTGKKYVTNKDCHRQHIRASSNMSFYRYMGFTIRRKQMRLESYIKRSTGAPTLPQPFPPSNILKIITNIGPAGT